MRRWELAAPPLSEQVEALSLKLSISKLLAAVLVQRGYTTEQAARQFLSPDLSHLQTPFALGGMTSAVERIRLAQQRRERVGVFGDYDVDGIVSTAILVLALKELGLDVIYRLPERLTEGYGLSQAGLMDLAQQGASLIITVDCGISSLSELHWAQEQGLDVIICDHHLPPPILPPAVAILNPKVVPNDGLFIDLSGAGVAFKFAWALHQDVDQRWLELAALGTVADVVPLVDENRVMVAHGLKAMSSSAFPGLQALAELAGVDLTALKAGSVSFRLAPRLNAAGRLGSAVPGVELFLTDDETKAYEIAQQLDHENRERQQIEAEVLAQAMDQVERDADLGLETALVVAGEGWHPGVLGIVASRLVDKWQRPSLVISLSDDIGKGSGRSIPCFSLYDGLKACSSYLTAFGGHRLAAGFSLDKKQLTAFRQAFTAVANSRLTPKDCVAYSRVDSEITLRELDFSVVRELELLAPFGYGNPEPVFLLRDVGTERIRQIGTDGAHLRLDLNQFGEALPAVGFGLGDRAKELTSANKADVIGHLAVTQWQGLLGLEFRLQDIRTQSYPVEICCRPSDSTAPRLVDWRETGPAFADREIAALISDYDLILSTPPAQLSELRLHLGKVPPQGRICLHFRADEVAAAQDNIRERYLDRDFVAKAYLLIKQAGSTGISKVEMAETLGSRQEETEGRIQLALTVLAELGLVEEQLPNGIPYFRLIPGTGKKRVDLSVSPTIKRLAHEKTQAMELLAFFAEAPPAILAEALGRLWRECQTMAEDGLIC